jgi:thiaminase/transcriptional activator TenA
MGSRTDAVWAEIAPVHGAILEHPFVTGLTDGTLPEDAFARYVIQDALFLVDYSRALALCAARSPSTRELRMFCSHATEAIDVERALHDELMGSLGIDPEQAARAHKSPTCMAYTSFLVQICAVRDLHEALGAILPCYWIYWEVGKALVAAGSPNARFGMWIETYSDPSFGEAVDGVLSACDAALEHVGPAARAAALRNALTAARYEWMFWDSALRDERWPV